MDQGTTQAKLLLHPAGKLAGCALGKGFKAGRLYQLFNPVIAFARRLAKQTAKEFKVLADRQVHIKVLAQSLGHIGDFGQNAVSVARVVHRPAQRLDHAILQFARTRYQGKGGGFTHTIGPDKADGPTCGDIEADIVKRMNMAVSVADMVQPRGKICAICRSITHS